MRPDRNHPAHHGRVRRVVILGRGGAGKSALAREISGRTGLPGAEIDELFWPPGPIAPDPTWDNQLRPVAIRAARSAGGMTAALGSPTRGASPAVMVSRRAAASCSGPGLPDALARAR